MLGGNGAGGRRRGLRWLVAPVGTDPQFTGADFTEDDLLYAKTAEDFVRHEVLPRLDEIEAKEEGLMPALLRRAGNLTSQGWSQRAKRLTGSAEHNQHRRVSAPTTASGAKQTLV